VLLAEYNYAECHYAEGHFAECGYAEWGYAEYHFAECGYAEYHYAECGYAECHYGGCRGTIFYIYAECYNLLHSYQPLLVMLVTSTLGKG
jgi:hypothetical protein